MTIDELIVEIGLASQELQTSANALTKAREEVNLLSAKNFAYHMKVQDLCDQLLQLAKKRK